MPSLEVDADGNLWPDGWNTGSGGTQTFAWVGRSAYFQPYSGNKAFKVVSPSSWFTLAAHYTEPFAVQNSIAVNKHYTGSVWVKTDTVSGPGASIKFDVYDGTGKLLGSIDHPEPISGKRDWTKLVLSKSTEDIRALFSEASAIGFTVVIPDATGGTMFFDGLRFGESAIETDYDYDSKGNYVTSITNPLGNTVGLQVDERGNTEQVTDPRGNITSYQYDSLDRIKAATAPYSPAHNANLQARYDYDGNGNIKTVDYYRVSDTGATKLTGLTYQYNELGLLKAALDPVTVQGVVTNYQTSYYYDGNANLSRVRYPNSHSVGYTYNDGADRLSKVTVFDGTKEAMSWDLQYDENQDGTKGLDRIKYIKQFDETGVQKSLITYGYEENSGLLQTVDVTNALTNIHKTTYGYSATEQVSSIGNAFTVNAQPFSAATDFRYANNGLNTMVSGPNGISVDYLFDEAGRVSKARYLQGSTVLQTIYAVYDDLGHVKEMRTENGDGSIIARSTYAHDKSGNITDEWKEDDSHVSYVYGSLNELQQVTYAPVVGDTKTVSYQYDLFGNRQTETTTVGQTATPTTVTYTYDPVSNRLLSINGQAVQTDTVGNVTQDDRNTYGYNGLGQLTSVTSGAQTARFEYNLDGLRISKTATSGSVEYFYYNGGELGYITEDADGAGTNHTERIKYYFVRSGSGALLYFIDYRTNTLGDVYTYLRNAHGDIIGLVDAAGEVGRYEYDAWGNVTRAYYAGTDQAKASKVEEVLGANPFRYAGYYYDSDTGLYYLKARYYDPTTGRFLSKDPASAQIADPIDGNSFLYALNNPSAFVDHDGRKPRLVTKPRWDLTYSRGELWEDLSTLFGRRSSVWTRLGAVWKIATQRGKTQFQFIGFGASNYSLVEAADEIAAATGGIVGTIRNGMKVTITDKGKNIVVRLMRAGSGGRPLPYLRVGIDGKGALTRLGQISNDALLTHFDLEAGYVDLAIKLVGAARSLLSRMR